jgi:hypothetical protein
MPKSSGWLVVIMPAGVRSVNDLPSCTPLEMEPPAAFWSRSWPKLCWGVASGLKPGVEALARLLESWA